MIVVYVAGVLTIPALIALCILGVLLHSLIPRRHRQTWHPTDREITRFLERHR